MEYVSDNLKDDEEVVMTAIKFDYPEALKFASERLRDNKEIVKTAVQNNPNVLYYASDR